MEKANIHHMIIFSLRHEAGSEAAEAFMRDAEQQLTRIPGVKQFRALRLKPNNPMDYGMSMVFDSQDDYAAYASHPLHDDFEEYRWKREATRVMVIDYDY